MRRIVYVSGSRADYGPVRRTLFAIRAARDLDLGIVVTSMHLDPLHGETWREIEADGFRLLDRVPGRIPGDTAGGMAASVGLFLQGLAESLGRLRPDVVLVLGDRGEMLAAAVAAAYQNVFVAHLCGGMLSGSIDDSVRHAITKFAHAHLVPFEEAARRVVQMGEDPASVHVVGLPGGDLRPDVTMSKQEVCAAYGLRPENPYLLVVQHPVTHSWDAAAAQATETLEAVVGSGLQALLANPNDDAGGRAISAVMERFAASHSRLRLLPPLSSREGFASVVAHAAAQVGNSSSGIREAMSVAVPAVNVGDRQRGREHLGCPLNVGYERSEILAAIRRAVGDPEHRARVRAFAAALAEIDTPRQVVEVLRAVDPTAARRPKQFHELDVVSASRRSEGP